MYCIYICSVEYIGYVYISFKIFNIINVNISMSVFYQTVFFLCACFLSAVILLSVNNDIAENVANISYGDFCMLYTYMHCNYVYVYVCLVVCIYKYGPEDIYDNFHSTRNNRIISSEQVLIEKYCYIWCGVWVRSMFQTFTHMYLCIFVYLRFIVYFMLLIWIGYV